MRNMLLPLAILTTALVGCSDPKKASEENFEKATQAWLDKAYPSCLITSAFPMESQRFDIGGTNKTLNALAEAGVLKAVETSRKVYPDNLMQKAHCDAQEILTIPFDVAHKRIVFNYQMVSLWIIRSDVQNCESNYDQCVSGWLKMARFQYGKRISLDVELFHQKMIRS